MDDSFPWDFVDGASQDSPRISGARGILHLTSSHSIHFAAGMGAASNNLAEFATFKILLRLSLSYDIS